MSVDRLREMMSAEPPGAEIQERAARARQRALAALGQGPVRRPAAWWRLPAAAAAFAVLVFAVLRIAPDTPPASPPAAADAPEPAVEPLRVVLTLDSGIRVVWTFDDSLSL